LNIEEFSTEYARARELCYEHWADEIIDVADDGSNDWMERTRRDGSVETVLDREHVSRSELRINARKWLLSKLLPKKFGDRVEHALTATADPQQLSDDQLAEEFARRGVVIDGDFEVIEGRAGSGAGADRGEAAPDPGDRQSLGFLRPDLLRPR
jgi:hypothetical protein